MENGNLINDELKNVILLNQLFITELVETTHSMVLSKY